MDLADAIARAARCLAHQGLVTAFGHVSARDGDSLLITPPLPLDRATAERCSRIDLAVEELPAGTPQEAWLHLAIYRARLDVGAICRAQPETATAVDAAGLAILPLHGQGSFCGDPVPVFGEPELVRDEARGVRLAEALGDGSALVMRGNGALTVAADPGRALARMWVLEASARINATAAAAGVPQPLTAEQQAAWRTAEHELLGRIHAHLDHQLTLQETR